MNRIVFISHSGNNIGLGHLHTLYPYIEYFKKLNFDVLFFSNNINDLNLIYSNFNLIKYEFNGSLNEKYNMLKNTLHENDILVTNFNRTYLFYYGIFFKKFKVKKWIQIDNPISYFAKYSDFTINGLEFVRNYFSLEIESHSLVSNKFILIPTSKKMNDIDYGSKSDNILVSMGGTDPKNIGIRVVKHLLAKNQNLFKKIIVLKGKNNSWDSYNWPDNVELIKYIKDIKSLMNEIKMIYTTPGLSFFEFLTSKIPIVLVDNGNDEWSLKLSKQLSRYLNVYYLKDENNFSVDSKSRPKFVDSEFIINNYILN